MTTMEYDTAETLFNAIESFIAESRALMSQGALMELAGLDDSVRVLCDRVLHLPQEERIRYADKFQRMLGDLKELGEEMAAQRDQVAGEIRGLPQHRKASAAYRVVNAIKGKDDDEE